MTDGLFFELIQVAVGEKERLSRNPSNEEWAEFFALSQKQAVAGVTFLALERLGKEGQKPPMTLLYEWIGLSEQIKQQNVLMNKEAARLTQLFENEGHRTVILKGQANASLYPNTLSRLPGDIDIWVSGGKGLVIQSLRKLNLVNGELSKYSTDKTASKNNYHIHLPRNEKEVDVEVHFRPSSGNLDPFTNRRLQKFLNKELEQENELVAEGFRIPSLKFALIMQLAHIQRHLIEGGIGLRQVMDYFFLLRKLKKENGEWKNNSPAEMHKTLRHLGLEHIAGAMMWVMKEVFLMDEKWLIAQPDERRGKMMLGIMMEGGNFGHYSQQRQVGFSVLNSLKYRCNKFHLLRFDKREAIWSEINFIKFFLTSIPERIRRRTWTLR